MKKKRLLPVSFNHVFILKNVRLYNVFVIKHYELYIEVFLNVCMK